MPITLPLKLTQQNISAYECKCLQLRTWIPTYTSDYKVKNTVELHYSIMKRNEHSVSL